MIRLLGGWLLWVFLLPIRITLWLAAEGAVLAVCLVVIAVRRIRRDRFRITVLRLPHSLFALDTVSRIRPCARTRG